MELLFLSHRSFNTSCTIPSTSNLPQILVIVTLGAGDDGVPNSALQLLAVLAQMVACLPLIQQVRGSIPGGVVNFLLKIFNLEARRAGDVHFLIVRLYITGLD